MSRWRSALPTFVRRAVQVDQMELDSALSQMYSLCTNPSLVSKMSRARMMTKGHYYRDDPAFLVLQLGFIVISTLAYGLVMASSAGAVFFTIFSSVLLFLISGLVLACIGRAVAVMYLPSTSLSHGSNTGGAASGPSTGLDVFNDYLRSDVDWRYAFDVHCNGYLTYFIWTQVIQYPFIFITSCYPFLANAFYLVGVLTYIYNVFLGYLEIPSLSHQQRLLYPALAALALYVLFCIDNVNISAAIWRWSWGTAYY
ncbi:hypothetical protein ABB37_00628 [Leptomonas pyrrhocoris]|uniref:Uncharacterized protein n=1 Tax=Leptomonas pyrrhocoris TaxID=157538 RepID=A0A0M9GAU8_LEPPY|nr:hypothetical protein ABB37_00628 [Leptomonas pyrrhocoris]KPA86477.1 hypothetical protein ABB37_00628 [Leptomonas pyrrhocoris]|eukprot:XP_015664916.1 hypothetical protein ABB37_00628 [Leptomonas pyrrhocoris]